MLRLLCVFLAAIAAGGLLTFCLRRLLVRWAILDVPNERSSHERPTPRGGGLAVVAVVLTGTAAAYSAGVIDLRHAGAVIGGGLAVASVGWADDRGGVSRRGRALVHVLAAIWAVWLLGGFELLDAGVGSIELGFPGAILAVVGIAWLINLYNFMDGIDGIAAGEAVLAGLAGGVLTWSAGAGDLALIAFLAAGASLGFLMWNWAPARIFMGDVGSSFLGYLFGVLALASERAGAVPLLAWAILLAVFIFDATITLLRRALRGERWYMAHRSHAYQRAVQSGWSHAQVSCAVLIVNTALAALAALAVFRPALLLVCCAVAAILLTALYMLIEHRRPQHSVRDAGPVEVHP
jgi:Fuc2NAc and GlcNAc transferase